MLYPLDGELKKIGIMTITELQQQYAVHPNVTAMNRLLKDVSVKHIFRFAFLFCIGAERDLSVCFYLERS